MTTEAIEEASTELAKELEPTRAAQGSARADWLQMVAEYDALSKPAYIVTKDGEKISAGDAKKRLAAVEKALKKHMGETGEEYALEGRGTLVFRTEPFGHWWAVNDMFADAPADFYHMLEERCMSIDDAAYQAAAKAGRMGGPEAKYRHQGTRSVLRWLQ